MHKQSLTYLHRGSGAQMQMCTIKQQTETFRHKGTIKYLVMKQNWNSLYLLGSESRFF